MRWRSETSSYYSIRDGESNLPLAQRNFQSNSFSIRTIKTLIKFAKYSAVVLSLALAQPATAQGLYSEFRVVYVDFDMITLQSLVQAGNLGAMAVMAEARYTGEHNERQVPQSYNKARSLYERLAETGDTPSQSRLGDIYYYGYGIPADAQYAFSWYSLAHAAQGNSSAQLSLGTAYRLGEGVERDDAEAVRWFQLVADNGKASAFGYLGYMYENGRGIEQDDQQAANGGVEWAQDMLDSLLAQRRGG